MKTFTLKVSVASNVLFASFPDALGFGEFLCFLINRCAAPLFRDHKIILRMVFSDVLKNSIVFLETQSSYCMNFIFKLIRFNFTVGFVFCFCFWRSDITYMFFHCGHWLVATIVIDNM
jgi:hypothetical protein